MCVSPTAPLPSAAKQSCNAVYSRVKCWMGICVIAVVFATHTSMTPQKPWEGGVVHAHVNVK